MFLKDLTPFSPPDLLGDQEFLMCAGPWQLGPSLLVPFHSPVQFLDCFTLVLAWLCWDLKGSIHLYHEARLQQYVNCELPDVQAGFRKVRGTRDQIANIRWIIKKTREVQKHSYFCLSDYAKAFDCVDHNKLWKIQKEMGIPDHLTCLLRNLYAGQEATVRTAHGTTDWFQIGKGVRQGCILSPGLFNFYTEYIM